MAIRFVDKAPEDKLRKAAMPKPEPQAEVAAGRDAPGAKPITDPLPFAKSVPKPRGRKKPLS